jgi:para-aminobenzoate synthetase
MLLRRGAAGFDNVVLSPGPGHPGCPRDIGHVPVLLRDLTLPVLGVCLGHQAIAHLAGAVVDPAPEPRHGHLTRVTHDGDALFEGLPAHFCAVRYHSLRVSDPVPPQLRVTARAEDGVVMALRHRRLPRWGVQFHPESVATEHGGRLLANFRDLSAGHASRLGPSWFTGSARPAGSVSGRSPGSGAAPQPEPCRFPRLRLVWATAHGPVDGETAFAWLNGRAGGTGSFWLDSARAEPGLSRFSFLAGPLGPLAESLSWRVEERGVRVRTRRADLTEPGDVLTVLRRRLARRRVAESGLPFDFVGGYVGYLGYEARHGTGPSTGAVGGTRGPHRSPTPDAAFAFVDRFVAIDHQAHDTYAVALHEPDDASRREAAGWVAATVDSLPRQRTGALAPVAIDGRPGPDPEPFLVRDREAYLADIDECLRQLRRGESYEICLTNRVKVPFTGDDLDYYRRLRRVNPAPYGALLRFPGVTVMSSSPECFLRIRPDGVVESKPIKGTAPRDTDPVRDAALVVDLRTSPKTRAENLMIVDLLRNDLGRVCEIGSVQVPSLLCVESYATVHQLVSTVRGRLKPRFTAVDVTRACFPGGSMTGAPKLRTMEIIDRLETEARGVYSGALGYFSANGAADLSIVIRTAVRQGDGLTIGAGGAIVIASDPVAEFEEMLLKAAAPLLAWRPPP